MKPVAACYVRIERIYQPHLTRHATCRSCETPDSCLSERRRSALGGQRRPPLVIGLGSDLIEIERIERSYQRFGDAFLQRVYTSGEIAYCMAKKNYAESLAARFAAKEAGAKALGTGISRGVSWREFEVRRRPGQRPELYLSGRALEIGNALGIRRISLTISHGRELSIAFVVAED